MRANMVRSFSLAVTLAALAHPAVAQSPSPSPRPSPPAAVRTPPPTVP